MAKSTDYPGNNKTSSMIRGFKTPDEITEPNLNVSIADMLAGQKANGANKPETSLDPQGTPSAAHSPDPKATAQGSGVIAELNVDSIHVSPFQPRLTFDDAAIEELANSISAVGLVKPLTVRPLGDGKFELIGGERRWRAHKILGRETVTAYVREVSDAMAKILALTDNEGQETLTEYERGRSYSRILDSGDERSLRSLARRVGVNHSTVSRCLLLLELPQAIREILDVKPELIGGKSAKAFIEYGKCEHDLVLQAVISMRDAKWSQEQALRWISKEISKRSIGAPKTRYTESVISGIGAVRVDGKKLELRCDKNVDTKRLAGLVEEFLMKVDRASFTGE